MANRFDVDHFNVVACREMLHVGNAINDRQAFLVDGIICIRLCDFSGKSFNALINMRKGLCPAEIVEIKRLEAMHRVFAWLATQWTDDVTVVIRQ